MGKLSMDEFADKMNARGMDVDGREMPDPRPMQPPVGFVKQPSMFDVMRAQVAAELRRRAEMEGVEGPEDAVDMGEDDEDVVQALTRYETYALEVELARRLDAEKAAAPPPSPDVPPAAPKEPGAVPPTDGPGTPAPKSAAP